jgi:ElaB/YqjD/DUF883 family membrane-anchored ribosome-binding protein
MDERDKRYTELRKDDQDAVKAALAAVDKATVEFKESQRDYNQAHNGLLQKMDEQHKETMPRLEANGKFDALSTKDEELRRDMLAQREELRREAQRQTEEMKREIQNLRDSQQQGVGVRGQLSDTRIQSNWSTGVITATMVGGFAGLVGLATLIVLVVKFASGH